MAQKAVPNTHKQTRALFERAVEILKHRRGADLILPSEYAALFYGFHSLGDENIQENLGTDWMAVAEAAMLAMDGQGIKNGELRKVAAPLAEAGGVDGPD
jgi:hypothetical protein